MSAIDRHLQSFGGLRGTGKRVKPVEAVVPPLASVQPVEYEILKELAASEWASLKSVDRAIKKDTQARYLEKYRSFLDAYIAKGDTYHNVILFFCVLWAADTGDFDTAIRYADVIAQTVQRFELGFKRDAITICCDEIMLAQEKEFDKSHVLTPAFSAVFERVQAKRWQPDNIITTGKFYRMAGRDALMKKDYKQAHDYFCESDSINPRSGCKKLIEQTASQL